MRFEQVGDLSWRVRDRGGLQTIRFPDAASLSLDMERSTGVLGATRTNGALYVSLDPVTPEPVVALSNDPAPSGVVLPAGAIAVARSDLSIEGYSVDGCTTGLTATSLARGHIDGVARPLETVRVVLPTEERDIAAAADGTFRLDLPEAGATPVTFRTDCGRG